MRPQIAMAAVVLMMIGTSAVLLRRSSPSATQPTKITEEGTPVATLDTSEGAPAIVAARPQGAKGGVGHAPLADRKAAPAAEPAEDDEAERGAAPPTGAGESVAKKAEKADKLRSLEGPKPTTALAEGSASAAMGGAASYDDAMGAYKDGRYPVAASGFDGAAAQGDRTSSALLYAGRSWRAAGKCAEALVRFRKVVDGYPGTLDAANAALEGGECARTLDDIATARMLFEKAKLNDATRARAEAALASLDAPAVKAKAAKPASPAKVLDSDAQ